MGYRFNNYSIFDIRTRPDFPRTECFLPVHSMLLTDKILHNRIMRNSGWLFQINWLYLPGKKYLFQHEANNLNAQEMMIKSAGKKGAAGFLYAHFFLPHWPFYRDSTGQINSIEYCQRCPCS
ncbi:MAG: hypothetical protein IPL50_13205 [Chitinophagaceae bacterium]|nr:hypothetical protein [Chitinophagaceae bacterium]